MLFILVIIFILTIIRVYFISLLIMSHFFCFGSDCKTNTISEYFILILAD